MEGVTGATGGAIAAGAAAAKQVGQSLANNARLVANVVDGLNSDFKGDVATAFDTAMTRWDTESAKLVADMADFEAKLRSFQQNMDSVDTEQATAIGRIPPDSGTS